MFSRLHSEHHMALDVISDLTFLYPIRELDEEQKAGTGAAPSSSVLARRVKPKVSIHQTVMPSQDPQSQRWGFELNNQLELRTRIHGREVDVLLLNLIQLLHISNSSFLGIVYSLLKCVRVGGEILVDVLLRQLLALLNGSLQFACRIIADRREEEEEGNVDDARLCEIV